MGRARVYQFCRWIPEIKRVWYIFFYSIMGIAFNFIGAALKDQSERRPYVAHNKMFTYEGRRSKSLLIILGKLPITD